VDTTVNGMYQKRNKPTKERNRRKRSHKEGQRSHTSLVERKITAREKKKRIDDLSTSGGEERVLRFKGTLIKRTAGFKEMSSRKQGRKGTG